MGEPIITHFTAESARFVEGLAVALFRVNNRAFSTTSRTLSDDHPLIKESHYALFALYPLTLSYDKMLIPAVAFRLLLAQALPMLPFEAEKALPAPALGALAENHALKIALLGTGMMLNRQLKRGNPTGVTLVWSEKVVVISVTVSSDTFSRECLQV